MEEKRAIDNTKRRKGEKTKRRTYESTKRRKYEKPGELKSVVRRDSSKRVTATVADLRKAIL